MFALVAHRETETNAALVAAASRWCEAERLSPRAALARLRAGDVALARLDVRRDVDGVEPGLWTLGRLAARGVRVLNPPSALLTAHDKLLTARELARAGLPHPTTQLVLAGETPPAVDGPVVVKPRFGSWGRDVRLCHDAAELDSALADFSSRRWFTTQGALVQELVPPCGFDLRVLVAGGNVIGAIRRRAALGEWRTNVALGGCRESVEPPIDACELAIAAADAAGGDLVGVDLLPYGSGWVVIEINGAVDFTRAYSALDPYAAAVHALDVAAELTRRDDTSVVALPFVPAPAVSAAAAVVAHISSDQPIDVMTGPSPLAGDAPAADGDAVAVEL
jgi:[lysine-biosynthesis-protein LysW]---L-2-aminoadipate ligase